MPLGPVEQVHSACLVQHPGREVDAGQRPGSWTGLGPESCAGRESRPSVPIYLGKPRSATTGSLGFRPRRAFLPPEGRGSRGLSQAPGDDSQPWSRRARVQSGGPEGGREQRALPHED